MLNAGVDPNMLIPNDYGNVRTPLAIAVSGEDEESCLHISRILISHGSALDFEPGTNSALVYAITSRKYELVRFLLSQSAVFPQDIIFNSLCWNRYYFDFKMVKILLEGGADVENPSWCGTYDGLTLVGRSVQRRDMDLLDLLLSWGANLEAGQAHEFPEVAEDIRVNKTTALGLAASSGSLKMVRALLNRGAQVNLNKTFLIPPLVLAVQNGHSDVTELLLAEGADSLWADCFRAQGEPVGTNLLMRALEQKSSKLCWILLEAGCRADCDSLRDILSLLLTDSIKNNKPDCVSRLIRTGAQVNSKTRIHQHDRPLGLAIALGNCEVITMLLADGIGLANNAICSIADLCTLEHLSRAGLLPSLLHSSGQQALISAILLDREDVSMALLSYNADRRCPSCPSSWSCQKWAMFKSPLEASICRGNLILAETLINRGACITEVEVAAFVWRTLESDDVRDFHPFWNFSSYWRPSAPTAIAMALKHGDHALVHRLLATGIDPRGKPLAYDDESLMSLVEEIDEDVFIMNGAGRGTEAGWWNHTESDTPQYLSVLELAASRHVDESVLQALLAYTWTSEAKGRAFTISLQNERRDLAQILLASNADVNQMVEHPFETYYSPPLLMAVEKEDLALTEILINAGCDVNLYVEDDDDSTTTILGEAVRVGDVDILKALLVAGAMVNSPCGFTNALNISVQEERLDIVALLLEAGADINSPPAVDPARTALQLAIETGNLQLVELLLEAGADVDQEPAVDRGATALQLAAIHGYIGIARRLIDLGANVNARGARFHGRTALEGAAEHGHIDTVRLLLEEGASVEGQGRRQYWRAVLRAEKNGAYATVNLLKSTVGWTDFDSMHATEDILKDDDGIEEMVAEMRDYFS
ncbi:hypothetical protein N7522_006005 [Penicillium canescens]|nr:hypothetical protein N7522_006005 [Penicillium canescens]